MMDGSGWSPAKEQQFENLGSATGAPLPLPMGYVAGITLFVSLCRLNPFLAPFVPKN